MGMVIKNNIDSVRTYNIYNRNTIALSNAMYKVSSGQRINSAADGASDLAISEKMRTRIQSVDQANRNTQNGINMIKTADGALGNITDILSTIREKLVNAANDTNGLTERTAVNTEVSALLDSITEIANNTSYNGIKLIDGSWTEDGNTTNAAVGDGNLYFQTTADNGSYTSFHLVDATLEGLGLGEGGADLTDLLTAAAVDATGDGVPQGSDGYGGAIDLIDTAMTNVLNAMTTLGALENRLGYTADNLSIESENLQASESVIRDQDMAKGMTDFAKYNILTQASQFMLAQASQNPYSVMNLLQQ